MSSNLVYLNLGRNSLKGPTPDALGDLTLLKNLYLFENQLNGEIPKTLGNLCSLRTVDLSLNSYSGNLESTLSGCVENSLENLWLSDNQFTGSFPYDITRFSSLMDLDLSDNQLNGVSPKTIGQLSKLEYLAISRNSFEGVISEEHLSNVSNLVYLDMSFNSLHFNLSSQWISPFQLEYVLLRSCKLGPKFPHWIQTGKVTFLDLSNNGISDSIPISFWNLSVGLLYLNLSSNNITCEISNLSRNFIYYPAIDLSSNNLQGSIPRFLSHTSSVYLGRNNFSGTLSFLNSIEKELLYIDVSQNQISRNIPDCWQHLPLLRILNLSYNKLVGAIPSSIGYLSQLETLALGNNHLSQELPMSLRNCTRLRFLDVSRNHLWGTIPSWIGENLSQLYVLILNSNHFRGSIPLQLCQLQNLQLLDLSINDVSGTVPECFSNFTAMVEKEFTYLFVFEDPVNNIFSFSDGLLLPSQYVDSANVRLKRGHLVYGINLKLLKGIDLSRNRLTGESPGVMTNLVGLIFLHLSRNLFYGNIPQSIGLLNSLESLDLSRNQFSGQIPPSLADLTFLSYLDLSCYNLSGKIPLGTQLQGFSASSYNGNDRLCGLPLPDKCNAGDEVLSQVLPPSPQNEDDQDDEYEKWFRIGAAVGFSTVFGITCGVFLLNDLWWDHFSCFFGLLGVFV